ncbi:ornithine cyclodeaminase family protein [soil metagenome]
MDITLIGAEQVRAALDFPTLVAALRTAFAEGAVIPPRHHHGIGPEGAGGTLLLMPAWREGGYLGVKIATIFPANGARGLPSLHAAYLLCDAATGRPLALIDGGELTARRTIAVSALAVDYLARPDASRLLLLGAGRIASLAADAFRAVRPIGHVSVWNSTAARADRLVADLSARGFAASRVDDPAEAARTADIISCATLSTAPLIRAEWLAPGVHLDLIGSFTPEMREAEVGCFTGARTFVDAIEGLEEAGDLIAPVAAGTLDPVSIGTLADLCTGRADGRLAVEERTIFKAVGTALADLTAAALVHGTVRA